MPIWRHQRMRACRPHPARSRKRALPLVAPTLALLALARTACPRTTLHLACHQSVAARYIR